MSLVIKVWRVSIAFSITSDILLIGKCERETNLWSQKFLKIFFFRIVLCNTVLIKCLKFHFIDFLCYAQMDGWTKNSIFLYLWKNAVIFERYDFKLQLRWKIRSLGYKGRESRLYWKMWYLKQAYNGVRSASHNELALSQRFP